MIHHFDDLPYAYDALEPAIDEQTMRIHHLKHHKTYYDKFIAAIEGTDLASAPLTEILKNVSQYSPAVRNHGGGYYNHIVYWHSMTPATHTQPSDALLSAINQQYGSMEAFKNEFTQAAVGHFGSGFAWLLVTKQGELAISTTANQDNPLMDVAQIQGTPILACDVWEHAYYLKHQNQRPAYVEDWWKVVNWDYVSEQFAKASQ
ncbi:superoxide dismutase [Salinibius halmophilus]|uniref:superoxide dismutase n=1 Tax=Salinibius halmophilus TaxID=1853216 RepID=UPI000E67361A|nr:superoxide dismutase [Salinibius halmophilus]